MVMEADEDEEGECLPCHPIATRRLLLRRPGEGDVEALTRLAANRRIAQMLTRMPHPYGEAEARAFVAAAAREEARCVYAVIRRDDDAFLGCAALSGRARGLELGCWIGEPHWGRGYGTEVAHALIDHAFSVPGVERVHAACRVLNSASRRVIQKSGFTYAGQGMVDSRAAGRVAVERYELDRKTWVSLKDWGQA